MFGDKARRRRASAPHTAVAMIAPNRAYRRCDGAGQQEEREPDRRPPTAAPTMLDAFASIAIRSARNGFTGAAAGRGWRGGSGSASSDDDRAEQHQQDRKRHRGGEGRASGRGERLVEQEPGGDPQRGGDDQDAGSGALHACASQSLEQDVDAAGARKLGVAGRATSHGTSTKSRSAARGCGSDQTVGRVLTHVAERDEVEVERAIAPALPPLAGRVASSIACR